MIATQGSIEERATSAEVLPALPVALPEDLERAHELMTECTLLLERIDTPPIDLGPAAASLEAAFEGLFATYERCEHPGVCAGRARAALERAAGELGDSEHPMLGAARGLLTEAARFANLAEERLVMAPWTPAEPAPPLYASVKALRLHALDRPRLVARVRVAPPLAPEVTQTPIELPTPKTFEELEAAVAALRERASARGRKPPSATPEPPPSADEAAAKEPPAPESPSAEGIFVSTVDPPLSAQRFAEERAIGAFEEVVLAWLQRAPIAGENWQSAQFIEQRLLCGVDALAALGGDALRYLEMLTLGNPTRMPAHLGALTLALGCIEGRDALGVCERLLSQQENEGREWLDAFTSALALVPHPDAPRLALRYTEHASPGRRALGTRVLLRHGVHDRGTLERAALDEPDVAAVALPALAQLGPSDPFHEALGRALEKRGDHAGLRDATLYALTLAYDQRAASVLWEELEQRPDPLAGILLGQYVGKKGSAELLEWVRGRPTLAGVEALGWLGSLEGVPDLIRALELPDDELRAATARSLERVTGAGLFEEVEVLPERILDPDVPEPIAEEGPSLARKLSSPRDLPSDGSPDRIQRPAEDAARWRAWWQIHGSHWDQSLRYRRGFRFSAHVVWRELKSALATPGERRLLKHELLLRTSRRLDLDPEDFVEAQQRALAAFEPIARAAAGNEGVWAEAHRRR